MKLVIYIIICYLTLKNTMPYICSYFLITTHFYTFMTMTWILYTCLMKVASR